MSLKTTVTDHMMFTLLKIKTNQAKDLDMLNLEMRIKLKEHLMTSVESNYKEEN